MDCSTSGLPVSHHLLDFSQVHVHCIGDAIQPSHPLMPFPFCPQSFPASGTFTMIREGSSTPLQYSCLESPMGGGTWWSALHGVAKSRTRLSDFTFTFHFHALEKEMATHSSVLAWRIPGMGEPGGLPSMGSQRVQTRLK